MDEIVSQETVAKQRFLRYDVYMRKVLFLLSISILCVVFLPFKVHAEEITAFTVDAVASSDGSVKFTETIQYDFSSNERHGIERFIPFIKTNSDGETFKIAFSDFKVTDERNDSYKFSQTNGSKNVTLRIGDPNRTITGVHTYIISYIAKGAITYYSDHDELYWNVTGSGWGHPIARSEITIALPLINREGLKATCFTGSDGSTENNCDVIETSNGYLIKSQGILPANQGLTAVVGFPKGLVAVVEPEPAQTTPSFFMTALIVAATTFWYVFLPIGIIVLWLMFGRDPKATVGAPHVWFDAPKTKSLRRLTPAELGVVVDEQADMSDITATIIDVARRGFIRITETKKNDFTLELVARTIKGDSLESFENTFITNVFSSKTSVRIKGTDFSTSVATAKTNLYAAVVKEGYFARNPETTRILFTVIAGFALFTMNIPLAVIAFIFGRGMPKKTVKGVEAAGMANALTTFLKSQDKQLEFQAKNQMFFEKMLPYAVAFGVEKVWAERFKEINMVQPTWYSSYRSDPFTSVLLINSLNSTMRSFSSAATPTRSSSGFSSGFSGGSSGGGGGGGGGGSW